MGEYVLDHHLEGEAARLALMSRLLDPMHRRHLESLGIGPGTRALEVGCGNGSISAWLAERVGPGGHVVAVDLDLSLVGVEARTSSYGRATSSPRPVDPGTFDIVTARAVLHHVTDADAAIRNLVASLAPGGGILLIEPDFLPVSVAEPPEVRAFWDGWLAWSRDQGIDYHIGRTLAPRLAAVGLEHVAGTAETAVYQGGSPWADYWARDGHRAPGPTRRVWAGRRQAHRRLPRPLRRSELVDRNDRLHRRPRPRAPRPDPVGEETGSNGIGSWTMRRTST